LAGDIATICRDVVAAARTRASRPTDPDDPRPGTGSRRPPGSAR